ncbi:SRPBCC family protein [Novosphingobium album (ex Liu et al. 2023)]|uniref:SRPBCC family protein n=1 Tax=Novosphingobium album (ex Liu et al. 2023) TaxID=3031130 RepID=UPI0023AEA929|nr:SRPBCC family protein [Novosphingobium album (ex Liu et al. 2023)]
MLEVTRSSVVTFSFLLVLPVAVGAFVSFVADPLGTRRFKSYLWIPFWLMLAVVAASLLVLHEGVICILMLLPIWAPLMLAGSLATWRIRKSLDAPKTYCSALLALPLLAMQVEPSVPLPQDRMTVTRSIVVPGSPEAIWPLLEGIPDVRPDEGRWNFTQDVIGVPRPQGARLIGKGIGAIRTARWGNRVSFSEVIDEWQQGERIGWRFVFGDTDGWRYTDRHLLPDGPNLHIERGGYRIEPLDRGHSRVTLHTTYRMATPVNGYAALWGEVFLGDLEENLLGLVDQRARQLESR